MRRPARPTVCTVNGCSEPIKRGMVMCRAHWFATPAPLRRAITEAREAHHPARYSAHIVEARKFHFHNSPAALADRITGDRA